MSEPIVHSSVMRGCGAQHADLRLGCWWPPQARSNAGGKTSADCIPNAPGPAQLGPVWCTLQEYDVLSPKPAVAAPVPAQPVLPRLPPLAVLVKQLGWGLSAVGAGVPGGSWHVHVCDGLPLHALQESRLDLVQESSAIGGQVVNLQHRSGTGSQRGST